MSEIDENNIEIQEENENRGTPPEPENIINEELQEVSETPDIQDDIQNPETPELELKPELELEIELEPEQEAERNAEEEAIPENTEEPVAPREVKTIPVIDHRLFAGKLTVYNWMDDLPATGCAPEVIEVRFKNTRKGFFCNPAQVELKEGDIVAVEAALGHDIGIVSLAGELVKEQIRLKRIDLDRNPLKKVYRKAKPHDIEKWQQAIAQEHETMIRSRKIAADFKLNMKIGDVEYQGDKTKAIFYYIAEDRVDFRALIKVLAETFHIRIEMKQIGARQEAGRIGGIGPCGLKLCCSTFITNFISVSTSAARYQDISLNPQKLAGQCGKLKCCLNYEVDAYIDEQKDFPSTHITLNTGEGLLYHQKTDIFGRIMYYAFDRDGKGIFIKLPVKRIKEIIAMNRKGIIPPKASDPEDDEVVPDIKYTDGVGEESLNRFDEKRQKKRHTKNRSNNPPQQGGNNNRQGNSNKQENSNIQGNNNSRPGSKILSKAGIPRPQKNEQQPEQPEQKSE